MSISSMISKRLEVPRDLPEALGGDEDLLPALPVGSLATDVEELLEYLLHTERRDVGRDELDARHPRVPRAVDALVRVRRVGRGDPGLDRVEAVAELGPRIDAAFEVVAEVEEDARRLGPARGGCRRPAEAGRYRHRRRSPVASREAHDVADRGRPAQERVSAGATVVRRSVELVGAGLDVGDRLGVSGVERDDPVQDGAAEQPHACRAQDSAVDPRAVRLEHVVDLDLEGLGVGPHLGLVVAGGRDLVVEDLEVALDLADVGDPIERSQVALVVVGDALRGRSGACPASPTVEQRGLAEVFAGVLTGTDLRLEDRRTVRHGLDAAGLFELVLQPFVEDCECSHEKKRLIRD
jgi:hypothetical protein